MPPGIVCTENVRIIVVANHNCRFRRSADLLEGIIKKTAVGLGYIYVVRQYQLGDIFIYTARLQFARLQIGANNSGAPSTTCFNVTIVSR